MRTTAAATPTSRSGARRRASIRPGCRAAGAPCTVVPTFAPTDLYCSAQGTLAHRREIARAHSGAWTHHSSRSANHPRATQASAPRLLYPGWPSAHRGGGAQRRRRTSSDAPPSHHRLRRDRRDRGLPAQLLRPSGQPVPGALGPGDTSLWPLGLLGQTSTSVWPTCKGFTGSCRPQSSIARSRGCSPTLTGPCELHAHTADGNRTGRHDSEVNCATRAVGWVCPFVAAYGETSGYVYVYVLRVLGYLVTARGLLCQSKPSIEVTNVNAATAECKTGQPVLPARGKRANGCTAPDARPGPASPMGIQVSGRNAVQLRSCGVRV
jgi:hypothetical protein